ncbi:MAG: hypothetical protein ACKV1O_22640 [Saprospiraceae bacterium]
MTVNSLAIMLIIGYCLSGCQQNRVQENPSPGICDVTTQQLLREYLKQPEYYQDQDFIKEFLNALALNASTATNQLEKKNREIKYAIEMDSLWRLFTEEDDFEQNEDSTKAEQYRLTIFTDILGLIEIYRIEKKAPIAELSYKKIRLVCQSPTVSGKALEKSCFEVVGTFNRPVDKKEEAGIAEMINKTAFWYLTTLDYHRGCFDGSSWKLEILKDGQYKTMRSYCLAEYDPVYLIGSQMIALTK